LDIHKIKQVLASQMSAQLLQGIPDMLRYRGLVDPKEGGDFALAVASEIVEGQAFVLTIGEIAGHDSPHLAHLRADKGNIPNVVRNLLARRELHAYSSRDE
jgi:hypothetical protein